MSKLVEDVVKYPIIENTNSWREKLKLRYFQRDSKEVISFFVAKTNCNKTNINKTKKSDTDITKTTSIDKTGWNTFLIYYHLKAIRVQ